MSSAANCCSVCEKPIKPEGVDGPDHIFCSCEKVADLKSVPNREPTPAEVFEVQFKALQDNMPQLLQMAALNAQLKKQYYNALIEEKFTPEQALHIICNSPATGGYL